MAKYADYTKAQLQELCEALPQELKDALFSQENADIIFDICERNIIMEKVSPIAEYVGFVLLGLLSPREFQKTLGIEVEMGPELAGRVAVDINRLIFLPLKDILEKIYGENELQLPGTREEVKTQSTSESLEKILEEKPKRDTYREPVE